MLDREIITDVAPAALTPRQVSRELRGLIEDGARLHVRGTLSKDPMRLLARYPPRAKIELFDTRFYLSAIRQNPDLRFSVVYVVQGRGRRAQVYARLFYKDLSLAWRSASHIIYSDDELWIGKGDVVIENLGSEEMVNSNEATTDLPLEIQNAVETVSRETPKVVTDHQAPKLVLQRAPAHRIEPFAEFTRLRRRAAEDPRNLINRGRSIARFKRKNVPSSLTFARGFEPDFADGIVGRTESKSAMYGGIVERYRILSENRRVQYLFMASPTHVWIIPPQALTTELSSFGLRTVDVNVDEDLCVPGFEYHFMDEEEDPPTLHSQIPSGFAGAPLEGDEDRADASKWLDRLPVIRAFRRKVL